MNTFFCFDVESVSALELSGGTLGAVDHVGVLPRALRCLEFILLSLIVPTTLHSPLNYDGAPGLT